MRQAKVRVAVCGWIGVTGCAVSAQWQGPPSVVVPELYVWGEAPPFWNDTLLNRTVQLNLYWGGYIHGAHRPFGELAANGPEYAAEAVAKNAVEGEFNDTNVQTQGPIAAGRLCLILQGIGEESSAYDIPAYQQRAHRFFRPNLTHASSGSPPKANGDAIEGVQLVFDGSDARSNQPYKHPLVINSGLVPVPGAGVNGPYEPSPMYEWMDRFCARYVAIQANPTIVGLPANTIVPNPTKWYFDAEPIIAAAPSLNSMLMLQRLVSHERWTGMRLPGDPLGRTAAQAFAAASAAAAAQGHPWPAIGGLDTNTFPQRGADQSTNRDLMTWWYTVCQHAQDAVMDYAVYSRIRAHWPNSWQSMKFGNYDDVSTDGVSDRTGWMQSPPSNFTWLGGGGENQCVERSDADINQTPNFPRVNLSKHRGSSFVPVFAGSANPGVWLGLESRASGTVDQPLLYPVSGYGYDGDCYLEVPGNKQIEQYDPNRYTGTRPWETQWESSMRLARHLVESAIHSTVGARVGNEGNVVPWTLMAQTDPNGNASLENFIMRGEVRNMLAMLRAKRTTGAAYWTPWNRASLSDLGFPIDVLWDAWADTQDSVRRVYATRVNKYTRTYHNTMTQYAPYDVDRLEYTLSNDETTTSGQKIRAEVAIRAKQVPVIAPLPPAPPPPPAPPVYKTEMVVDFEYVDNWPLPGHAPEDRPTEYLDLRVECATDVADVKGMIFVYDWGVQAGNPWVQVDTYDYFDQGVPYYLCYTGQVSGRYENRRHFEIPTWAFTPDGWFGVDPADGKSKTRVKYVHLSGSLFWSWYDLTQVIPSPLADPTAPVLEMAARSAPLSDVNHDGVVNDDDLDIYVNTWLNGEGAADMNGDAQVEGGDLTTYVESFITGT